LLKRTHMSPFEEVMAPVPDNIANTLNKVGWETKRVASAYTAVTFGRQFQSQLQHPEVMILAKYHDSIFEKRVLDIGCGAGRTTRVLTTLTRDYVGLDYSSRMIDVCKRAFESTRFFHGDVRKMDMFGEKEFDFVLFSYNGLDFISHEDRLQGLGEIRRVLKQDGIFAFSSLNRRFREAISRPKIRLTPDIRKQMRNILFFPISVLNFFKNRKHQIFATEYSIVVDNENRHGFLAYQICKEHQVLQLDRAGFETIEMYDTFGKIIGIDSDDADSPWIYYVAKRK